MTTVPLHALRIGGKFLIEHCAAFSYGQTLGLFLENHETAPEQASTSLRVVVGDNVPLYELMLPKLAALYAGKAVIERPREWAELMASMQQQPTSDTMFACHGLYAPDDPERSLLELVSGAGGAVDFDQVFAELDLRGGRSVIMGACESGLARTEIDAEYIGLPSAMLASGVRHVVGALWTIPQLATAVLTLRLLELMRTVGVCAALHQAQCDVMAMTRDALSDWFRDLMQGHPELPSVLKQIAGMGERPFAHPYHWAGLHVIGDL
jgi:CHAT domain-containing protein